MQFIESIPPVPALLATSEWLIYAGFFGVAVIVSALATLFIIKTQHGVGMDVPDTKRKFHERPVSRLGGAALYIAVMMGMLVALQTQGIKWDRWMPLILCNTLMFFVGFLDDLRPLGAKTKLVGQIGTALILFALGTSIDMLSNPFGEGSISLGWWSLPLTLLWLVAIPNIVNLIDGMDGLATGFGMFICLTLAFVGWNSYQPDVTYASLVMAGALAGFLIFNFPPARIFLGDGGAYFIGFYIASVSLLSSNKGAIIAALLVMMLALGVPILDTLFAILRRAVRGVPIFRADAEHIHHRLILLGYTKGQALIALYAVSVALSLVGVSVLLTKGLAIPVAGAVLFILAVAAARYLGYVRSFSGIRGQFREVLERRKRLEHLNAHARVLELEVDRCVTPEEFGPLLHASMKRMDIAVTPSEHTTELVIPIDRENRAILYADDRDRHHLDKSARIEAITPCLETAWEKWRQIPGVLVAKLAPVTSTSSIPPASLT